MHHGQPGRRLGTMMAFLMISLIPIPGSAGSPASPEEEARLRSEWEKVRENQERTIKDNENQIAEIYAKERGASVDQEQRAGKITQDRLAGVKAFEMYKAQDEYLGIVTGEWGEGAERRTLQAASTALQKNIELIHSYLARVTEAAGAASTRVRQSTVLEKAARSEATAREAEERLSARWERERAAREREREQREREAGERARERRL